jgi:predicted RNA-binding protein associated with RNAse of E/G family
MNLLYPSSPLVLDNLTVIDSNYVGIWFSSTQYWFDVGAIYDRNKNFKGYYCDICTPIKRIPEGFNTTDLILDLWIFPNGQYRILDQEEYRQAVKKGWIPENQQKMVETELHRLIKLVKAKKFPSSTIKKHLKLPENIDEIVHALKQCNNTV